VNTHLDPQHYPEQQQIQVTQLYDFVLRLLQKIPSIIKYSPKDEEEDDSEDEEKEEEAREEEEARVEAVVEEGDEGAKRVRTQSESKDDIFCINIYHNRITHKLSQLPCFGSTFQCFNDWVLLCVAISTVQG